MKKTYEIPEIVLTPISKEDVISTSAGEGDTPKMYASFW